MSTVGWQKVPRISQDWYVHQGGPALIQMAWLVKTNGGDCPESPRWLPEG